MGTLSSCQVGFILAEFPEFNQFAFKEGWFLHLTQYLMHWRKIGMAIVKK